MNILLGAVLTKYQLVMKHMCLVFDIEGLNYKNGFSRFGAAYGPVNPTTQYWTIDRFKNKIFLFHTNSSFPMRHQCSFVNSLRNI